MKPKKPKTPYKPGPSKLSIDDIEKILTPEQMEQFLRGCRMAFSSRNPEAIDDPASKGGENGSEAP